MQRRTFLKNSSTAGFVALVTPAGLIQVNTKQATLNPSAAESFADAFLNPPMSARAQVWWHWMNGNVTADGITRDLEAMQQVGLGGFQNFDAGTGIPKGPVVYLSPEWLKLKEHAIKEADRLGLQFTMHNCPGWSSSGGPWITPELAMQQVTWSETCITGGKAVTVTLAKPLSKLDYYRDVAVLAFPALPGETALSALVSKATASGLPDAVTVEQLAGQEGLTVTPVAGSPSAYWQVEFKQPYEARSLTFLSRSVGHAGDSGTGGPLGGGPPLQLEASDNGVQFRKVATINAERSPDHALSVLEFPLTKARYFRLTAPAARVYAQVRFSGTARLDDWRKKTNKTFSGMGVTEAKSVPGQTAIALASVIDVSQYMRADGVLTWTAPAGDWTILRVGYTPNGELNRSAPDTGVGLECDKYSQSAIDFHFNKMMEHLLPTLAPLTKKGKVGLLIDSYEVGMQNWTARFPQEFEKRAGYSLLPYLPTLTGRIVGDVDTTERFLWDFRRTQADLMADKYYGRFRELCQQQGIVAYTEPYDRGPMEEMQVGARVDVNMGEFWNGLSSLFQNNWTMRRTTRLAASIAHINGKQAGGGTPANPQVVGAEAFTGEPESSRWQEYPFAMKALGDKMFTQGLNQIIFHRYAHQPHPTALPGMTMGPWGIHFDRTTTWWSQGRSWLDYLARCQSLLQQGLFVADLAYFTGEEGNQYTKVNPDELNPPPPATGYDYDLINGETLVKRAKMAGGKLTLPDGMSYRVLVLQNHKALSLELLHKLQALVQEGLVLVGAKPALSLGLRAHAQGETEFQRLTTEIWGAIDGTTVTEHRLGKGRVFWGPPIQTILDSLAIRLDVEVTSRSGDAPIMYIHRQIADAHVYFLANQRRTSEDLVCLFRVAGLQPECWDASTGKQTPVGMYELVNGQTQVPIRLEPAGSVFVVFRSPAKPKRLQIITKGNEIIISTRPFPRSVRKLYRDVTNTFTISLWAKPELNVMLDTNGYMENIKDPWTDYYAIYPPPGTQLYGAGHATCGLTVGRNGVAVWEHTDGKPVFKLAAPVAISGWNHVALVYKDGAPSVYVQGKLIQQGKTSGQRVHPGLGPAYLSEGASFYNGDMTEPQLAPAALTAVRIQQLAAQVRPQVSSLPGVETAVEGTNALRFWQNGRYTVRDNTGRETALTIAGIEPPNELTGSWQVRFPPDRGAPEQITLPNLMSLNHYEQDGVKYFSGTATYTKTFDMPASAQSATKRVFLDLGRVEVMAGVTVNGKDLGVLWKRPYQLDITDAVKAGTNTVDIRVTNLWPNRLIGDEQLPDPDQFTPGGGASGFASLSDGAIVALPQWYKDGKPKPADGRVTFTTWKHYRKDSPLLESGLIGPVVLRTAEQKTVG